MLTVGFDIYETSPGNLLIYAINHRRTGSTIERFHHTVGSGTLVYERSFDCNNDIVYTPNDVAIIGKDEFYVTNVSSHRCFYRVNNRTISMQRVSFERWEIICVCHCRRLLSTIAQRDLVPLLKTSRAPMES
jgi:hypothetical protein